MASDLIKFQCAEPRHLATPARNGVGTLTVNEGAWARCVAETFVGAHVWEPTEGTPLRFYLRPGATSPAAPVPATSPSRAAKPAPAPPKAARRSRER